MCYRTTWVLAIGAALSAVFPVGASALELLGQEPTQLAARPSAVPNQQAMTRMIWAPGIDDGYVPQGMAWAEGAVYLSAYKSTDPQVNRGACRIFKVDPASGHTLGQFDLPSGCGHVGGLAYAGHGLLIAADTRRLYTIDLLAAFQPGKSAHAVVATVALRGELKGSFVDVAGDSLFIGVYDKDAAKSKGYFVALSVLAARKGQTIDASAATRTIPLPPQAQGAAFDRFGNLWVSTSGSRFGQLLRLESQTGRVVAAFDMVSGIEDLAFDAEGGLWSVSEAGSLRWQAWRQTFPVLFRLDLAKLKPSRSSPDTTPDTTPQD